jgi:hypothetical protein
MKNNISKVRLIMENLNNILSLETHQKNVEDSLIHISEIEINQQLD